ncbi:SMC-Scp complex subunit ScpB [Heyndrickxia ginsengihumi]|uniref:Segregation and condensation protein B n=1 Tax=Heyndrickxia ginsengihumi TaxID=363870 RepID=A0A0A6VE21_9BACI|nr:SMC-Scp complex subunit ScpB [Heyndrickxia ginsengihumi]KHD85811.1 segregation and condensation protein B [Heyndrickxia ginsengihumi]MBE6184612.1 SMC-Scp complex subunit ScpB [Bacillus sp. (in: firmicutes)]MCM3022879.1 SMC-Scp complex subunit ScpB [Heyndrickxia ginsengihumi]NEY20693.1 SMC-Scp complex subunit ScpB [Heyndrickxia ginsengihumi]
MDLINWKGILESLLFAAGDEGLSIKQITTVMEIEEFEAIEIIESLKMDYESNSDRGITIIELADTYQLATKKENAVYLKKLVESPNTNTLSQAALETLAIISYKQPITRIEIEEIRGVKTERPLQTLMAKGLIQEVGRQGSNGRAIIYGTTKEFLDHFGLKDLKELPPFPEKMEDDFSQDEADLFFEKFQDQFNNEQ